ncbi:MAG: SusD/RagB family nutrient-binding outer membrane lipoprotein [Bacteroidales bacterium]|nr:SusD/RagB family nutrient-binding outer membrane lipoprotein [Bacteroidales bacterium]
MKRLYKILSLALVCGSVFFYSCETTELDITENPNALVPSQADVDFFLNSIQEDFARQLDGDANGDNGDNWTTGGNQRGDGLNDFGQTLTRMYNIAGRDYQSMLQSGDGDDEWANAYSGYLIDIKLMNVLALEAGQTHHIAIGQFIEAYTMVTLVDFFGDVPYTEALDGANNLNPVLEPGAEIYDKALILLTQAIDNFSSDASTEPQSDLFYNGDYDKWIKAANTLKMKIYLQRRLVDGSALTSFNAIVASGNYITNTADDFEYKWPATSNSNPDTRHPRYGLDYTASGASDYMSNWLMNLMDTSNDPRIRYYFFRQTNAVPGSNDAPPDEQTLSCSLELPPQHYIDGGFTFCWLDNGYWGRDHGDDDGIPPDGLLRTVRGVYPTGGRFDDDSFIPVLPGSGGGGIGITAFLTAAWVDFYKAEFAMANGDMAGAKAAMLDGITKSIAKTQSFISLDPGANTSFEPTGAEVDTYINGVDTSFDAADSKAKWNILSEQFWVATFGNGVEPYNYYRRTGFPTTLQPNIEPNPGTFVRSLFYPDNTVNTNSNVTQKADQTQPVFWDTNGSAPEAN